MKKMPIVISLLVTVLSGCSDEEKVSTRPQDDLPVMVDGTTRAISDPIIDEKLEDPENDFLSVAGSWKSEDGIVQFEIFAEGDVFKVEADYGGGEDHPINFSFQEYDTYFEYKTRAYKVFFQGSNPQRMRLLWKGIEENGFKEAFTVYRVEEK